MCLLPNPSPHWSAIVFYENPRWGREEKVARCSHRHKVTNLVFRCMSWDETLAIQCFHRQQREFGKVSHLRGHCSLVCSFFLC